MMTVKSMVGAGHLDARRIVNTLISDPVMAVHFQLSRAAIADDVIAGKRDWLGDDIGEIAEQYDYRVNSTEYRSYMNELLGGRTLDFWQGVYHIAIGDRKAVLVIYDGDVFLDGGRVVDPEFRDRILTWKALDVSVPKDGTISPIPDTPYNVTSGALHFSSPNFTWNASDELETHLDRDLRLDLRGRLWDQGVTEPTADNVSGNTVPLGVPHQSLRAAAADPAPSVQLSNDYSGTYTTSSMDTAGGTPQWGPNADLVINVKTPTAPSVVFGGSDVSTTTMFATTSPTLLAWNDTTDSGTAAELAFYKDPITAKAAFKGYLSAASATGVDKTKGRNFSGQVPPDQAPPAEDPVAKDTLDWTIAGTLVNASIALGGIIGAITMFMYQRATDKKQQDLEMELGERPDVSKEERDKYKQVVSDLKDYGVRANRDVQELLRLNPKFELPKNKQEFDAEKKTVLDLLDGFDAKNARMQQNIDQLTAQADRHKATILASKEAAFILAEQNLKNAPSGSKVDQLQRAELEARDKFDAARRQQAAFEKSVKDTRDQKTKRENSRREYMLRHNIYKKLDVKNGSFHVIHG
jgi:hypothetical protein